MERYLEQWGQTEPSQNEFYTSFSYYPLKGLEYEEGVSRRDPSTIIKIKDTYYVYYTRSSKTVAPVGYKKATKQYQQILGIFVISITQPLKMASTGRNKVYLFLEVLKVRLMTEVFLPQIYCNMKANTTCIIRQFHIPIQNVPKT